MVLPAIEGRFTWQQPGNADETFQQCREKDPFKTKKDSFKHILTILANQADPPVEYNQVQIICIK